MACTAEYPNSTSGWQPYQPLITRLYRDEDRPLREVMKIMETQHGFKATNRMYKSRIRAWGLDKKNKRIEVQEILRLRDSRKSLGKDSTFVLRGRHVDMADIERYAKRIGLTINPGGPTSTRLATGRHLICLTPPTTPPPLSVPDSFRNVECFLHSYNAFMINFLRSGAWRLGDDIMGFATVIGLEYPRSARNAFFLSVERGVQRYRWDDISQAYRQWRLAFSTLPIVVRSRNPSQMLCLVELLAQLADCKGEVATLLLRYLGDLVAKEPTSTDTRLTMLWNLSQLETNVLDAIAEASLDCSRKAFREHFSREGFFLLDSETVLMDSGTRKGYGEHCSSSRPMDLVSGWDIYDYRALRAARTVMELLMALGHYTNAERFALYHLQRMKNMPYNGVVGGAFSHAYNYLTHLYLLENDFEKAYHSNVMKVENYFEMLIYRTDLPDDYILLVYSGLSSLARRLGKDGDAEKWNREYSILKARTDCLAESDLLRLQAVLGGDPEQKGETVDLTQSLSIPTLESLPETNVEEILGSPPCKGHIFEEEESTSESRAIKLPFRTSVASQSEESEGSARGWKQKWDQRPPLPPKPKPCHPLPGVS